MASTYVNDLRLNEMATGDASGSWGTVTNTNLELIGEALGYGTEGITTNANTHTTTVADGATDPGRAMYIEYTGTLDSACTITIAPNTLNRMHFIENGTSGSQNIIIKQGSGATITIPPGDTKAVYLDGAGSGAKVVDAFASLNVVDLKVQDDLTVTDDATIGGTLGVTGVLTTTAATVFNGGFASNAASTVSTADNLDTLSLISTDADANVAPNLRMYRNSGSPADSDQLGKIQIEGRNDNSQDVIYGEIGSQIVDASDGTEDGRVFINTMVAGSLQSRMNILATEVVFNEENNDQDFRVESNDNDHMLFVDGGNNRVGIGVAPTHNFNLEGTGTVEARFRSSNGDMSLQISSDADETHNSELNFMSGTSGRGSIVYDHNTTAASQSMNFKTGDLGVTAMTILGDGKTGIGTTDPKNTLDLGVATQGRGLTFSNFSNLFSEFSNASFWLASNFYGTAGGSGYKTGATGTFGAAGIRVHATGGGNHGLIQFFVDVQASKTADAAFTPTERMRIAGTGLSDMFSTTSTLRLRTGTTGTSGQVLSGFEGASTNANGTQRFVIFSNGNMQNTNNSYGALSDRTLKENIVDATDKLSDIKQVKVRNFNFIGDSTKQIGVVAQELETVFPALVETIKDFDADGNQLETETKSVKYSVFVPILMKAMQEQQTIIEDLKTRIETLEG